MAAKRLLAMAAAGILGAAPVENRLAPIAKDEARSTHGPFEAGDCFTCHDPEDRVAPGRPLKGQPALCFDCHEEFRAPVKSHPESSRTACTRCHSPHNSKKRKLLL